MDLINPLALAQTPTPNKGENDLKKGDKALLITKNYSSAMKWYQKAALWNAQAENQIGWLYQNGYGVDVDLDKAMDWYQKSAALGCADAQDHIGEMYFLGTGVDEDKKVGLDWIQKAANLGNVKAEFRLGDSLLNGFGIPADEKEGLKWLQKASDQGNEEAKREINTYISMSADTTSPDMVTTSSGLQYLVLKQGTGAVAQKGAARDRALHGMASGWN